MTTVEHASADSGNWAQPITLTGRYVTLVPMEPHHVEPLWRVGNHESIWRFMPFSMRSKADMERLVSSLLADQAQGVSQPFVTTLSSTGDIVGSTSYLAMSAANRRLEIGATWVTPQHQRSPVNTEAKLLQLNYAFDQLACNRVEFKTDSLNTKSRKALGRIGAQEEGTHRCHMVMPDGRLRHSVYFSVVAQEWATVREGLETKLNG